MFRLEKVFQNDDLAFILLNNFFKILSIFIITYFVVILKDNSIHELFQFRIFKNSNYFLYSIILTIIFFINLFFFKKKEHYKSDLDSFVREDIFNLFFSNIFTFAIIFIFNFYFIIEIQYIYLLFSQIIVLFLIKLYFNYLYNELIKKNIIQKNVMLIGTFQEIKKILNEKFDKSIIFKCCIITDINHLNLKLVRSEIKFPIFKKNEDIRSILEYHFLGQIWLINYDESKSDYLSKILKFSVDTLNIFLKETNNIKDKKLLANKYQYEFYEKSKFFGVNLFLKLFFDKIFSLFFLIIAFPIIVLSSLAIYIEDGFPIIFSQNRTGWDGRRFKIYKLRSLKKILFDKKIQVTKNDSRLLKSGKIIRKYSIDELPQFVNVLRGEMSIVGPRPHMVEHDIYYSNLFSKFLKRHKCNPGLTGWAQVNGLRGATTHPDYMKKRMDYDLWYLNNWSLWLDFFIILKTFYAIFKFKGD